MYPSSPDIPTSFDPAIHLHSEVDTRLPSENHSDEIEAQLQQIEETRITKNREGIVIQHRAWRSVDAFRSEEDYIFDTPTRTRVKRASSNKSSIFPSSPPTRTMPFISSPVAYPATSSPAAHSPRKRRKLGDDGKPSRSPLDVVDANKRQTAGPFLEEDDDDSEEDSDDLKARLGKRKAVQFTHKSSPPPMDPAQVSQPSDVVEAVESVAEIASTANREVAPTETRHGGLQLAKATTESGRIVSIAERRKKTAKTYEQIIASRSNYAPGEARQCYYGLNIHQLMDDANREDASKAEAARLHSLEEPLPSIEQAAPTKPKRTLMWTEKYRAKKFTDLVGDERTHRSVLRWLKGWDSIVFPGSNRPKPKSRSGVHAETEEQRYRKILLLTGPPGLGKTTLAHVCARQAGYEAKEINASDERSKDVVKGRIRDMVGTENVRGIDSNTADGKVRKAGRPVCVIVDEVDGVVGGSGGGGEGGFVKALIDLIHLDQRNANVINSQTPAATPAARKKKGDKFRLLRPIILICNDLYHPSLRPLRQSSLAEVVHIRKPPLGMVISRIHSVFEKEGIPCDSDGVRRLCEATWGVSNRKEGGNGTGTGEGDIRSVMVVGEWVAGKLRACVDKGEMRLTKKWVEEHILGDLGHGGGAARSLGRGGAREVAERIFQENAGFPKTTMVAPVDIDPFAPERDGPVGVAEANKSRAMQRLREMVDTSGDADKIVADCHSNYATYPYQDDTFLTKPNTAYEWLHFHDIISSSVHTSQEWELAPYLSQTPLAFHHLFASSTTRLAQNTRTNDTTSLSDSEPLPFTGPTAPYSASEALKANKASLSALHASLSLPLTRTFRSPATLATDLLPYVTRMLAPDVKPVIIQSGSSATSKFSNTSTASVRRGAEKQLVARAVNAMIATGVRFERSRVEYDAAAGPGTRADWVFRMEPPLDAQAVFETLGGCAGAEAKVRFAVRQVLEAEYRREVAKRENEERKKRGGIVDVDILMDANAGEGLAEKVGSVVKVPMVKKDFFGRVLRKEEERVEGDGDGTSRNKKKSKEHERAEGRVWVSYNEGFSNAVRKPITLKELLSGF
ncbi:hypothetical protein EJ05DRAFT_507934 [Pseudovirgaria hyperparasitica]|uniref:AAA+ ATPase domain-containing protein n=1 Tax=Pseudovirgaria hyperparasitica TaxID=470096 RepID=A0A6A6WJJ2_9PEZI|nr:uncharacterized protein EJ05DRAFT_507934 [Pseudovirgaria hyperparasitica]KAF2762386.1 hypothetical protein EJ05DRAFT_507934 [Pseudovirgaria hyperparasitica]